ncbi:MAG: NAD-dependent DNA ligase LigA [Planctomycetes bacterium]|nr:NAD-dependent DNA ligase LigA [Planctomycetota bacterium]
MTMDDQSELNLLRERKRELDRAYYQESTSLIGDEEYDRLVLRLRELEQGAADGIHEHLSVGSDLSGAFAQVPHRHPMLSIDNTYSEGELKSFIDGLSEQLGGELLFSVEPKIDGLSLSLWYEGGKLVKALTRGNGRIGEDVTANALTIEDIPKSFSDKRAFAEVRGEVYMRRSVFEELNRQRHQDGSNPFANPRNAASGALKLKDCEETASRRLSFWPYQLMPLGTRECIVRGQGQGLEILKGWGFPVSDLIRICEGSGVLEVVEKFAARRAGLDFETDGMVVKLDSYALREELGETARSPRWAIAYKYPSEQARTILKGVTLQVGRTGVITPVAELQPVSLAGSVVRRASLHNFKSIQQKRIFIGAEVWVKKAGEIIPQVTGLCEEDHVDEARIISEPTHCPACKTPLKHLNDSSPVLLCPNLACSDRLRASLIFFCSRGCMDIDGMGEKIIESLIGEGVLRKLSDIYRLRDEDLQGIEGMAEKSISQLLAAIAKSRSKDFVSVLVSLGIPGLGHQNIRGLLSRYRSMEELQSLGREDLEKIDGIGPTLAGNLVAWFSDPGMSVLWRELRELGLCFECAATTESAMNSKTSGKTFVISGTLLTMSRSEAEARLRQAGATVKSGVTKKTDYLVVGDQPGSKLEKAKSLQIPVIGEGELIFLLRPEPAPQGPA